MEETGWTGFAAAQLRKQYSILSTGLTVGILWGKWHFRIACWASDYLAVAHSWTMFVAVFIAFYLLALPTYRVLLVFVSGRFQFVKAFQSKHWVLLRNLGKIYLLFVFAAALKAIYLAFTSSITQWYTYGLVAGAAIWIYTGAKAYFYNLNRSTQEHRKMMIRNYVVTFFFIIFFGIYDLMVASGIDAYNTMMLSILPWACLLIPLVLNEYFITKKSISLT